jgi:hypothetical protein
VCSAAHQSLVLSRDAVTNHVVKDLGANGVLLDYVTPLWNFVLLPYRPLVYAAWRWSAV